MIDRSIGGSEKAERYQVLDEPVSIKSVSEHPVSHENQRSAVT